MPKSKFIQQAVFNWPVKILSLFAAVLIFVMIQVSMTNERAFSIPLEVVQPREFQVETTIPTELKITVKGPEDEIFRILPEQISAVVDFSDVREEGVHSRAVELNTDNVVGISPMVTFHPDPDAVKIYFAAEGETEEQQ